MHRNKLRITFVALASAALFTVTTPASGDGGAKTQIKITKLGASGASGKIASSASKCEGGGRRVQFFKLDGYVSDKIQKTTTKSNGSWRIQRNLEPGRYFAKVDASQGCRYDNSRFETLR